MSCQTHVEIISTGLGVIMMIDTEQLKVVFSPALEIQYAVVASAACRASRMWLPQGIMCSFNCPHIGETARVWARLCSR